MVSSYVKSLGFFLKRSTNFSFVPITMYLAAMVLNLVLSSKLLDDYFHKKCDNHTKCDEPHFNNSVLFHFLKHLAGLGDHFGELGCGVFYLGGTVEELLVVGAGLLIVLEDVGVSIGDVEIGSD